MHLTRHQTADELTVGCLGIGHMDFVVTVVAEKTVAAGMAVVAVDTDMAFPLHMGLGSGLDLLDHHCMGKIRLECSQPFLDSMDLVDLALVPVPGLDSTTAIADFHYSTVAGPNLWLNY